MQQAQQVRQGDVFLNPIASIPKGSELIKREKEGVVLARGPVTGHTHAFASKDVEFRTVGEGEQARRFLRLKNQAALKHQEHAEIKVKPGVYEVLIQREFSGGSVVNVED